MGRGNSNVLYQPLMRPGRPVISLPWLRDLINFLQTQGIATEEINEAWVKRERNDFSSLASQLCRRRLVDDIVPLLDYCNVEEVKDFVRLSIESLEPETPVKQKEVEQLKAEAKRCCQKKIAAPGLGGGGTRGVETLAAIKDHAELSLAVVRSAQWAVGNTTSHQQKQAYLSSAKAWQLLKRMGRHPAAAQRMDLARRQEAQRLIKLFA